MNRGALVAIVVVGLVLLSSSGRARGKAISSLTGEVVEREHSWDGSAHDWASSRFDAAVESVKAHWGGEVDDARARAIALSLLTHWAIETGDGAGEFNFNVGNINASGAQKHVLVKDVDGTIHAQRAYDTLGDGIDAYIRNIAASRYASAAKKLADDPSSSAWFIALGRAGWFNPTAAKPASSWDAAAKLYESKRASLAKAVGV